MSWMIEFTRLGTYETDCDKLIAQMDEVESIARRRLRGELFVQVQPWWYSWAGETQHDNQFNNPKKWDRFYRKTPPEKLEQMYQAAAKGNQP